VEALGRCKVGDCGLKVAARGMCQKHYVRFRKHGSPDVVLSKGSLPVDPEQRFREKYKVTKAGCWLWTGALNGNGWPIFSVGGKAEMAHRFAYERYVDPIPDGDSVRRTCGEVRCVNPGHLELMPGDPVERFWTNVVKRPDGHWTWKPSGFVYRIGEKSHSPRRLAYQLVKGSVPEGLLYSFCKLQMCINPEHSGDAVDKFWGKVDKNADGCWYWLGSTLPSGYPHLTFGGESVYAHRLSYVWAGGRLKDGKVLTQSCGHKACVNPEHLEQITYREMVARRRQLTPQERKRATAKAAATREKNKKALATEGGV
jgi:hypothetical protein